MDSLNIVATTVCGDLRLVLVVWCGALYHFCNHLANKDRASL